MGISRLLKRILDLPGLASKLAGKAVSFLSFSAADERLRPRKVLSVSIEKGAVDTACISGLLFYKKIIKAKRLETGAAEYPDPAAVASASKSMLAAVSGPGGRMNAALVIPEEWVIQRKAVFPVSIRHAIPKAVSYDLDRLVPLGAGQMLYDWSIAGEDERNITLDISAVKSEKVSPYIERLKGNGINVSKLIHAGGLQPASRAGWGAFEALRADSNSPNLLNNGLRRASKFPVAGTALLACVLIGALAYKINSPVGAEKEKIDALNRQITIEKTRVGGTERDLKEIGLLNGDLAAIDDFNLDRPVAIRTVKALTAIIPKSAWLTGLKLSGDSVQIEGYAQSATGLVPRLEKSGYFKKAEFASPTTRDPKTKTDHFIIKAELNKIALVQNTGKEKPSDRKGRIKK